MKKLDAILAEMTDLVNTSDPEIGHIRADALLCEALSAVSVVLNRGSAQKVADIIAAFEKMSKWYA